MVRRIASHSMGQLLQAVAETVGGQSINEDGMITSTLLPLYEELASSNQPVRLSHETRPTWYWIRNCWISLYLQRHHAQ
jgi:hypothetical protein